MVEEGWTTAEIIERLLTLMRKMDAEGLHVLANTAWLASERLRKLEHFLLAERERATQAERDRVNAMWDRGNASAIRTERERCAEIADEQEAYHMSYGLASEALRAGTANMIATAIRTPSTGEET